MIGELKILTGYAADLPALKGRTFRFKEGLNVLFGENGVGKSSIIKIAAAYCGVPGNGGWSRPPNPGDFRMGDLGKRSPKLLQTAFQNMSPGKCTAMVDWDGTASFLNTAESGTGVGSVFADAAEDSPDGITDFSEQLALMKSSMSAGQVRLYKFQKILGMIDKPPDLRKSWKGAQHLNDVWLNAYRSFSDYVGALPRTGRVTVLLDEPDRNMSIENQVILWTKVLPVLAKKAQVIVATHSPFALDYPDESYIELTRDYLAKSRLAVLGQVHDSWAGRSANALQGVERER